MRLILIIAVLVLGTLFGYTIADLNHWKYPAEVPSMQVQDVLPARKRQSDLEASQHLSASIIVLDGESSGTGYMTEECRWVMPFPTPHYFCTARSAA
jgi:hypothetical protein